MINISMSIHSVRVQAAPLHHACATSHPIYSCTKVVQLYAGKRQYVFNSYRHNYDMYALSTLQV